MGVTAMPLDALRDEVLDGRDLTPASSVADWPWAKSTSASGCASSQALAAFSSVKKKSTGNLVTKPSFTTSARGIRLATGPGTAVGADRHRESQRRGPPTVVSCPSSVCSFRGSLIGGPPPAATDGSTWSHRSVPQASPPMIRARMRAWSVAHGVDLAHHPAPAHDDRAVGDLG